MSTDGLSSSTETDIDFLSTLIARAFLEVAIAGVEEFTFTLETLLETPILGA